MHVEDGIDYFAVPLSNEASDDHDKYRRIELLF